MWSIPDSGRLWKAFDETEATVSDDVDDEDEEGEPDKDDDDDDDDGLPPPAAAFPLPIFCPSSFFLGMARFSPVKGMGNI